MRNFIMKLRKLMGKIPGYISFNSPFILIWALVALVFLALDLITGGGFNANFASVRRGSAADIMFYVRLLLHPLGHADWSHYAGNMALMLIVGPPAEERYGWKKLLAMTLVTSVLTGLVHILISSSALLGSSGIVFMMMMLCAVSGRRDKGKLPLTLILACAAYLGQEIASGITLQDNVSQLAHIMGGVCGAVFAMIRIRKAPSAS